MNKNCSIIGYKHTMLWNELPNLHNQTQVHHPVQRHAATGTAITNPKYVNKFEKACKTGNLNDIIKCHTKVQASTLIHGFCKACLHGNESIVCWLLDKYPTIDVSINIEYPFRMACAGGYVMIARMLLAFKPTIDIYALNDYAFELACRKRYLYVAQLLVSLNNMRYEIETDVIGDDYIEVLISWQIHRQYTTPVVPKLLILDNKPVDIVVECCVCQQTVSNVITECNHQFCEPCLTKWLIIERGEGCPYCRQQVKGCYRMI